MPYVNLQITKGATREQKAELVKDMTNSLVRVLGKKPEHIHVVIQEINEEDWGFSGLLTDDWKQQSQSPPNESVLRAVGFGYTSSALRNQ
ncbi:4-oxalocrotonate tautomerase family protein [Romeria aff. gracilis LEGE 07310]|uniref:Tautomerase n=1 Tax=Vasconcelosia minhoensis LEGE 07310 TaxID=915328 RepID=A0A8J7DC23_9CYAN|nr:4-oxalocrotonate tautomerase family protein [Romeria aff. gracilis LEGE 07310]